LLPENKPAPGGAGPVLTQLKAGTLIVSQRENAEGKGREMVTCVDGNGSKGSGMGKGKGKETNVEEAKEPKPWADAKVGKVGGGSGSGSGSSGGGYGGGGSGGGGGGEGECGSSPLLPADLQKIPPKMSNTAKATLKKAVDAAAEAALHLLGRETAAAAAAATAMGLANSVGGVVLGRPQPLPAAGAGEMVVLSHVLSPKVAKEWMKLHSKVGRYLSKPPHQFYWMKMRPTSNHAVESTDRKT
jgi:hypothetical protein